MKTIINDEIIEGNPLKIESELKIEIANQILKMGASDYENTIENMKMVADIFEILEENIDKEFIRLEAHPMGGYVLKEVE